MKRHALACGLIVLLGMLVSAETAVAATCVWQGGGNPKWSTAGNWLCGMTNRAPVNGDSLSFPATGLTFTSTNDIAGLQLASITISSPRYIINGVGISLSGGTFLFDAPKYSNDVIGATFMVPIALANALTISDTSTQRQELFLGDIDLNGFQLSFEGGANTAIHERGVISGNGRVANNGAGNGPLVIEADATFTGQLFVNSGEVLPMTVHGLGASGPATRRSSPRTRRWASFSMASRRWRSRSGSSAIRGN